MDYKLITSQKMSGHTCRDSTVACVKKMTLWGQSYRSNDSSYLVALLLFCHYRGCFWVIFCVYLFFFVTFVAKNNLIRRCSISHSHTDLEYSAPIPPFFLFHPPPIVFKVCFLHINFSSSNVSKRLCVCLQG